MNVNIEELKRLAEAVVNSGNADDALAASMDFMEAVDPAAILELIRQRDELLAAAKLLVEWMDAENDHSKEPDFYKRMEMCILAEESARAAIAKEDGCCGPGCWTGGRG